MSPINISEILKALDAIIKLEKQISEAVANEKDKKRRKKLAKAIADRDVDALRKLLFDID